MRTERKSRLNLSLNSIPNLLEEIPKKDFFSKSIQELEKFCLYLISSLFLIGLVSSFLTGFTIHFEDLVFENQWYKISQESKNLLTILLSVLGFSFVLNFLLLAISVSNFFRDFSNRSKYLGIGFLISFLSPPLWIGSFLLPFALQLKGG